MVLMKRKASAVAFSAAVVIGWGLFARPAQAAYTVDLTQMGSNVVASGSGTLNLAGLTGPITGGSTLSQMDPSIGGIVTGTAGAIDVYTGLTGPASFGPGGSTSASIGTGNLVGVESSVTTAASTSSVAALVAAELFVPSRYMSGLPLSDTATYLNKTLAGLGATPGTYTWSWTTPGVSGVSAASDDTFTLVIAAVPEPSTVAQFGVGLAGLVLAGMYRRRRQG
jgi:hypothetical protein